ncbi:MAG: hypothetical protein JZD40_05575 [Sulfolobus sp.]|nr:hypothetical protein [Sulfolobus sp.]
MIKERDEQVVYEVSSPVVRMHIKFDTLNGKLTISLEGYKKEEVEKMIRKRLEITVMH